MNGTVAAKFRVRQFMSWWRGLHISQQCKETARCLLCCSLLRYHFRPVRLYSSYELNMHRRSFGEQGCDKCCITNCCVWNNALIRYLLNYLPGINFGLNKSYMKWPWPRSQLDAIGQSGKIVGGVWARLCHSSVSSFLETLKNLADFTFLVILVFKLRVGSRSRADCDIKKVCQHPNSQKSVPADRIRNHAILRGPHRRRSLPAS